MVGYNVIIGDTLTKVFERLLSGMLKVGESFVIDVLY